MFGFSSIGHAFATVAHDLVKAAKVVAGVADKVQAVVPTIQNLEPVIEGIEQGIVPASIPITRAAFYYLGEVLAAVQTGKDVVKLAEADIAALKSEILPIIQAFAKAQGVVVPVQ